MTWPRCSTVMVSAMRDTTLMLCSTISTVRLAATCLISAVTRSTSSWPMPCVGSSSSISSGSMRERGGDLQRALAAVGQLDRHRGGEGAEVDRSSSSMARSLSTASVASRFQKWNEVPSCAAARRARSRAPSGAGTPPTSGTSGRCRGARPRPAWRVMSSPSYRIWPRVGARNLVSRLKKVVLPAPFGPISAWMCPRRTRRSTLLTATKPLNSLVSPRVSMMQSSAAQEGAATMAVSQSGQGAVSLPVERAARSFYNQPSGDASRSASFT